MLSFCLVLVLKNKSLQTLERETDGSGAKSGEQTWSGSKQWSRPSEWRRKQQRAASCWPLTPAAIMRPVIMECVIGRRGVGRAGGIRVQTAVGRLVAAVVPGRVLQRQRNPLTFVTWRWLHTGNRAWRVLLQENNPVRNKSKHRLRKRFSKLGLKLSYYKIQSGFFLSWRPSCVSLN